MQTYAKYMELRCPDCNSSGPFKILATGWFSLEKMSGFTFEDTYVFSKEDIPCRCVSCESAGFEESDYTLADFKEAFKQDRARILSTKAKRYFGPERVKAIAASMLYWHKKTLSKDNKVKRLVSSFWSATLHSLLVAVISYDLKLPQTEVMQLRKEDRATFWHSEYFQAFIREFKNIDSYREYALGLYEAEMRNRYFEEEQYFELSNRQHQMDCMNAQAMGMSLSEYLIIINQSFLPNPPSEETSSRSRTLKITDPFSDSEEKIPVSTVVTDLEKRALYGTGGNNEVFGATMLSSLWETMDMLPEPQKNALVCGARASGWDMDYETPPKN